MSVCISVSVGDGGGGSIIRDKNRKKFSKMEKRYESL